MEQLSQPPSLPPLGACLHRAALEEAEDVDIGNFYSGAKNSLSFAVKREFYPSIRSLIS